MAEFKLVAGESVTIPRRTVTEAMLRDRDHWLKAHGLGLETPDPPAVADVLQVNIHPLPPSDAPDAPLGANVVDVEITEAGVVVTAKAAGYAAVDIIDQASAPAGVAHEFWVERKARSAMENA